MLPLPGSSRGSGRPDKAGGTRPKCSHRRPGWLFPEEPQGSGPSPGEGTGKPQDPYVVTTLEMEK